MVYLNSVSTDTCDLKTSPFENSLLKYLWYILWWLYLHVKKQLVAGVHASLLPPKKEFKQSEFKVTRKKIHYTFK